jgi:hypothetical protein
LVPASVLICFKQDVLLVDRTRNQENIRMFRVSGIDDTEPLYVIHRGKACQYFYVTAVAAGTVIVDNPGGFCYI